MTDAGVDAAVFDGIFSNNLPVFVLGYLSGLGDSVAS